MCIGMNLWILGGNLASLCKFKTFNEDSKNDENKWFNQNK